MSPTKRVFDLAWTVPGLVLLGPLLLVIAVCVKLSDGGPALFKQWRVGHRGRLFRLWKFRTMVPDAAALGGALTVGADARVTPLGAWLRRLKLDELPQLVNVLRGEMSLVGPRPEVPPYVERYTPAQRRVLELVPGMTDRASLRYRDEAALLAASADAERLYADVVLPDKIRLSLAYAAAATRWTDFLVVLETLRHVWAPQAARRPEAVPRGVPWCVLLLLMACGTARVTPQTIPSAASGEPSLNPGDVVRLTVWRAPEFSGEFRVGTDSALAHPLYRAVKVAGVPLAVVRERLRVLLAGYEQNPQVVVEPLFAVAVGGEVRLPNLYTLPEGTTIAQAVALAGGPTERGRADRVRLVRGGRSMTVELTGPEAPAPTWPVRSGDQVFVDRRSTLNLWRDVLAPLASVTAAVAAVINVSRR